MHRKLFQSDILFTGYYGQLNTGDDAFIEVASWGAEKYWKKSENIFLAKEANLPDTSKVIRGYPFSIPRTYSLQSKILLSSTNYLISAGGSTMHSELPSNNIKSLAVERKKSGKHLKVGGIGVSVGPFKSISDEQATIEYLKNIDFLAVRDQASFDFVSTLNLPYQTINAFDLAALLPDIYGLNKIDTTIASKKTIGVSVCPVESINDKNNIADERSRNRDLVELLKYLDVDNDIHMKFFVINGNPRVGDLKLTLESIERIAPKSFEIIHYTKKTRTVWNEIESCDFVISSRLHAAIFACFSNTPFMLNEYHRKCGDFLDNVGYEESLRLFNNEYSPKEKAGMITNILNDNHKYPYPKYTEEMKQKSKLNFTGIEL